MLNYDNRRVVRNVCHIMFKVSFHTPHVKLVKLVNSVCHWLLSNIVPDLLQCASKVSDTIPLQWSSAQRQFVYLLLSAHF